MTFGDTTDSFGDAATRMGYETEWVNGIQRLKLPKTQLPTYTMTAPTGSPWGIPFTSSAGNATASSGASPWTPVGTAAGGTGTSQPVGSATSAGLAPVGAPSYPALPDYGPQTSQVLGNISSLLNPSYGDMDEARMKSAAKSYGQGTSGSAFANNGLLKMLDSEKIKRQELGAQLLEPYLQRNTTLQTATMAQQGETYRAILAGQQAMERLKLSEQGLSERLSASMKNDLQMQVLRGQQALAQGYQSGMFGLENTSLQGQYHLAGTNLNPLTQQTLRGEMLGTGSAYQDAATIAQRYGPMQQNTQQYGLTQQNTPQNISQPYTTKDYDEAYIWGMSDWWYGE